MKRKEELIYSLLEIVPWQHFYYKWIKKQQSSFVDICSQNTAFESTQNMTQIWKTRDIRNDVIIMRGRIPLYSVHSAEWRSIRETLRHLRAELNEWWSTQSNHSLPCWHLQTLALGKSRSWKAKSWKLAQMHPGDALVDLRMYLAHKD